MVEICKDEGGGASFGPGSREPSPEGLGPTGFDPSRITDLVATLDVKVLEPFIKKAADEFYGAVLDATQDYFRDNLDWNLRSHLEALQRENQRMRLELYEVDRIVGGSHLLHEDRLARLRLLDKASVERMMLIMAVEPKHDGETRLETALRYIRSRGRCDSDEHRNGEDAERLSGEAMPARAEGIAQGDLG